jgi:hypothetical protein
LALAGSAAIKNQGDAEMNLSELQADLRHFAADLGASAVSQWLGVLRLLERQECQRLARMFAGQVAIVLLKHHDACAAGLRDGQCVESAIAGISDRAVSGRTASNDGSTVTNDESVNERKSRHLAGLSLLLTC